MGWLDSGELTVPDMPGNAAEPDTEDGRVSVAVVEDDDEYRESLLVPALVRAGYSVDGMASALELYRSMTTRRYDLVLLDVGLPDDDGFSIARHLRGMSQTVGIVMLTGYVSPGDRMRGLDAGVDVYLTKPTDTEVLVATLRNLARRVGSEPVVADPGTGGQWRLTANGWCIASPGGTEVTLSLQERQVVTMLAATPGSAVRRERLIARLVENVHDFDPHRLEMLIHRLRRKCLKQSGEALPLHAVRSVGYVLTW